MKKGFIKIGSRVLLLIVILFISNEIYKRTFWQQDLDQFAGLLDSLNKVVYKSDILYFAESSNASYLPGEENHEHISELIQDFLPETRVNAVNKGALHARIYLSLCKNIPEDSPVKTVIVTLNMRSFNADWINSELETALMQQNVMLQPYPPLLRRFLLAFKAYDNKRYEERVRIMVESWKKEKLKFPYPAKYETTYEWDKALANGSYLLPDGSWDMKKIELATSFVKAYAFQIDTNNNPRIKDFDKICEYARERGWKLVFNLLAENFQKARELAGDDLVFLMKQNRDLLVERYRSKGVIVVDNLEQVADQDFIDKTFPTEHYVARGRIQIAYNVAKALHKSDPSLVFTDFRQLPLLENNFDQPSNWNKSSGKTNETASSGRYAEKINAENPYSETFEVQVSQMFKSVPKTVELHWKSLAGENVSDARMVVDIQRGGKSISWKGVSLVENRNQGSWSGHETTAKLPDDLRPTDIIKIYAWNPSEVPVYVDDIKIRFTPQPITSASQSK